MKNRFVISENDKRSILSMYGLLTEDVGSKIIGQVQTSPQLSDNTSSSAQNLELKLYGNKEFDDTQVLGDDDISEMDLLATTRTDNTGSFTFDNIKDSSNLLISFEGNDFFEPTEYLVDKISMDQDNKVTFIVKYKKSKEEIIKPLETLGDYKCEKCGNAWQPIKNDLHPYLCKSCGYDPTEKKCEKKESNEKRIYGYGEQIIDATTNFKDLKDYDKKTMFEKSSKNGIKDSVEDYLELNPNEYVTADELNNYIISILGTEKLKKLKVICKKTYIRSGKIIATTVIKFKKTTMDEITQSFIESKTPVKQPKKIEFDPYGFKQALQVSFDYKRKIFLFFCDDNNSECSDLLNDFVELGALDFKLKNWVRLYYNVDRSETDKYVIASETIGVDTYPTVVILEAIKDPRSNNIKDSIKVYKKITSFDQTFNGMNNLLQY